MRAGQTPLRCRRLVLSVALFANLAASAQPVEPEGYRIEDYRAPTPETVAGGAVLDTNGAHELWKIGAAVWIDVLPAPRRPANLPAAAFWMPLPHLDIPGSLWLPDVGRGVLSPELESFFRNQLEAATNSRKDAEVVFYCLADCWMSWNARNEPQVGAIRKSIGTATAPTGGKRRNCRQKTGSRSGDPDGKGSQYEQSS